MFCFWSEEQIIYDCSKIENILEMNCVRSQPNNLCQRVLHIKSSNPTVTKIIQHSCQARGDLFTDLSIYPYSGTSADLSKITTTLQGIVNCCPGIDPNMKISLVFFLCICAYFDVFIFGQNLNFSFEDSC